MKKILLITVVVFATNTDVLCQSTKSIQSFEKLWKLFDERYASFEEKHIDWDSMYTVYRPRVTEDMSEMELFTLSTEMLKPLEDGHVNLIAKSLDTAFSAERYSRINDELDPLEGRKKPYVEAMIDHTLSDQGFGSIKKIGTVFQEEDTLFSYTRTDKIGYLRFFRSFLKIKKMMGSSLDTYLDMIFADFKGVESIIVDVRFNMGGTDEFSKKVAGRFISEEHLGFTKQTRKKKVFGELKKEFFKPTNDPFLGPVVLLTNDQTVSAADVLAIIMAPLPNVTLIGEPSNGSFSDLYGRRLPNKWIVTLSNQRYYSVDMKNYEGVGVPVDIMVKNSLEDVETKNDSVLKSAIDYLNKL
ncbi:MAG: S41 family peptidase [Bacteroidota bacterium]